MRRILSSVLMASSLAVSLPTPANDIEVELQLPEIQTSKYQRPFVAIWLERNSSPKTVETLAVWYNDRKWLKDIRRWWRKAGRYDADIDAVTGATRAPGRYQLQWSGSDEQGKAVREGRYTLYLEAVREHGNRTLLKQKLKLGGDVESQHYQLPGGLELGSISIRVGEKTND